MYNATLGMLTIQQENRCHMRWIPVDPVFRCYCLRCAGGKGCFRNIFSLLFKLYHAILLYFEGSEFVQLYFIFILNQELTFLKYCKEAGWSKPPDLSLKYKSNFSHKLLFSDEKF